VNVTITTGFSGWEESTCSRVGNVKNGAEELATNCTEVLANYLNSVKYLLYIHTACFFTFEISVCCKIFAVCGWRINFKIKSHGFTT